MSFTEAIKSGFDNYANFEGRSSRPAYWWWFLFSFLVSLVINIGDRPLGALGAILGLVIGIALFIPGLAIAIRRLHDTDRSGWWVLIALIPLVGFIVLIVFLVTDGTTGPNQYGDRPIA